MNKVYIIAEAGVNHNGSLEQAKKLVDVAIAAGADAVKFQTFDPESTVTVSAKSADYQRKVGYKDQLSMLSSLSLNKDEFYLLRDYCGKKGIDFLSTAFDLPSFHLLHEMGQKIWKIPSGDITNVPLIESIGKVARSVILSTGMATLGEIEQALDWLKKAGTKRKRVTVLHCNTDYPTSYKDVNLLAMNTIAKAFGVQVGYSDHTEGVEVPIAAVALGASMIEKHFTLDRNLPGPDHKASIEPAELAKMILSIRNIEKALGSPHKSVTDSEKKNKKVVRKGIYAAREIQRDEAFTKENIITKRPEHEVPANEWHRLIGLLSNKKYSKDEPISW